MFGLTYPTVLECVYMLTSILSTLSLIYVIHTFSDDVDRQFDEMYLMRKKLETQILKLESENHELKQKLAENENSNYDEKISDENSKLKVRCDMLEMEIEKLHENRNGRSNEVLKKQN